MSEEYARELTKLAVAKASVALGYKYAQPEVVDCLSDVVRVFIDKIAVQLQSTVESYGRTNPGVLDLIPVLDKMVAVSWAELQEFALETPSSSTAASSSSSTPSAAPTAAAEPSTGANTAAAASGGDGSSTPSTAGGGNNAGVATGAGAGAGGGGGGGGMLTRSKSKWNLPFPHAVPLFPVSRRASHAVDSATGAVASTLFGGASGEEGGAEEAASAFPAYLPPFPPAHTYRRAKRRRVSGGAAGGGAGAGGCVGAGASSGGNKRSRSGSVGGAGAASSSAGPSRHGSGGGSLSDKPGSAEETSVVRGHVQQALSTLEEGAAAAAAGQGRH